MALARHDGTAVDEAGNVISNAWIEVRRDVPGRPVVPLFSDRNGTVAIGNPFQANDDGTFGFHAPGGAYYIRAYTGPGQNPTTQRVRRYVPIGTAGEYDTDGLAGMLQAGLAYFDTEPELSAFVPTGDRVAAIVAFDPVGENNGLYAWDDIDEEWVFKRPLDGSVAKVTLSGDADEQLGVIGLGTNPTTIEVFKAHVVTPNAGAMTLSINGETARAVLDYNGDPMPAGVWSGTVLFELNDDGDYQLLTDGAAAASAAASAAEAEAWAAAAGGIAVPDGSISRVKLDAALIADIDAVTANLLPPGGRLTLTADTPFPTADVAGATTIYYEPTSGAAVPVFNGTSWKSLAIGTGVSLPLDADSGHTGYHASAAIYDLFAYNNAGALEIGTGPSWAAGAVAGSTTNGASYRGTGAGSTELELYEGLLVNKNAITLRFGASSGDTVAVAARQATYLGSFEPTANGQASDSASKRCLFNAFNQTLRPIFLQIAGGATYNYSTGTFRQVEGDTNFLAKILFGLAGGHVDVEFSALVQNSTSTGKFVSVGIALTSTTPSPLSKIGGQVCSDTFYAQPVARYTGNPGIGRHSIVPVERGAGSDTQTWLEPVAGSRQTGLMGTVLL